MLNQNHDLHFNMRKLGLPHGLTQKLQGTMPWGKKEIQEQQNSRKNQMRNKNKERNKHFADK